MRCLRGCGGRCCLSEGRGLHGHLELVADLDVRGITRLRHQSFRSPMHLSKPHHEAGVLVVNMVNPTAGLLEGDRLRIDVRVEQGARLLLTAPSASRVHAMHGGDAKVVQRLEVKAGSSLDWCPEVLIPQSKARYRQETNINVQAGGELLFFESLAPGRTAYDEVFAYQELHWATDLRVEGRWLARERYRLSPHDPSIGAFSARFPQGYYAGALLVSPALTSASVCWQDLRQLQNSEVWSGTSQLGEEAFSWKLVAANSLTLRRSLRQGREMIYASLGRSMPRLRRGDW